MNKFEQYLKFEEKKEEEYDDITFDEVEGDIDLAEKDEEETYFDSQNCS